MTDVQEYLVIEDTGEVLLDQDTITLVSTEIQTELIEVAEQGPPGPAFAPGGPLDMMNQEIIHAKLVGFYAEFDAGASAAAKTIVLADAQKQKILLTADAPAVTIDVTNAPVGHYQLRIIQDATGGHVPSFPGLSAGRWLASAAQPPVNLLPNGESLLNLYWDGANLIQSLSKVGAA